MKFGRDPSAATAEDIPFAETVSLGFGEQIWVMRSRTELADTDAWILEREHFRGHGGPVFSALYLLARPGPLAVSVGPHMHCASPPVRPPAELRDLHQISIQPAGPESCLEWWTVDLFVGADGKVVAVTMDLWEP